MKVVLAHKPKKEAAFDKALVEAWSGLAQALGAPGAGGSSDPIAQQPGWARSMAASSEEVVEQALLGWTRCEALIKEAGPNCPGSFWGRSQELAAEAMGALSRMGFFDEALRAVEFFAAERRQLSVALALAALCQGCGGPGERGPKLQALAESPAWSAKTEGKGAAAASVLVSMNKSTWAQSYALLGTWAGGPGAEACMELASLCARAGRLGDGRVNSFFERAVAEFERLAPQDLDPAFWGRMALPIKAGLARGDSLLARDCFERLACEMESLDAKARDQAGVELSLWVWSGFNEGAIERLRGRFPSEHARWLSEAMAGPRSDGLWGMKAEAALRAAPWAGRLLGESEGAVEDGSVAGFLGLARDWATFFERLRCAMEGAELGAAAREGGQKAPRRGL